MPSETLTSWRRPFLLIAIVGGAACSNSTSPAPVPPSDAGVADTGAASADTAPADAYSGSEDAADPRPTLEGWDVVPDAGACDLRVADLEKVNFPPRVWAGCGTGCLAAPGPLAGEQHVLLMASSGAQHGSDFELHLEMVRDGRMTLQVSRLSDGKTIAAIASLRQPGASFPCGFTSRAPYWFAVSDPSTFGTLPARFGAGGIQWGAKYQDLGLIDGYAADGANHLDLGGDDGRIFQFATPASDAATLATDKSPVFHITEAGGRVFWTAWIDASERATLRGLAAGAPTNFVTSDAHVIDVQATPSGDRLVWMESFGPHAPEGGFDSAQLVWSPTPTSPSDLAPVRSANLWGTGVVPRIVVSDTYVAAALQSATSSAVQVMSLSTQKLWTIHTRPGKRYIGLLGMGTTELVLAESDAAGPDATTQFIPTLLRFDLSKLDDLAASW